MEEGRDAGVGGGGEEEFSALELPPPPPLPAGGGFQPAVAPGFKDEHLGGPSSEAGGRGYQEIMPKTAYKLPERDTQVALRPGFGRNGRPVALYANHFAVKLLNSEDFYHYNVSIEPPVPNKKINREVISKLRETFGQLEFKGKLGAYDGEKSLFTSGSLNFNSKEFKVYLEDQRGPSFRPGDRIRSVDSPPPDSPPDNAGGGGDGGKRRRTAWGGRDFVVRIEFAARVSMKPIVALLEMKPGPQAQKAEAALRVLDVVLREVASSRNYLLVRENFFHPDLGDVAHLGEGVDGWRGFHSSIRPTNKGLSLNLDVTMTCVLEPVHVVDFLAKHFNVRSIEDIQGRDWRKAKQVLKNVRIETTHMRTAATHKIAGFSDDPISALSFPKKVKDVDGNIIGEEQISVEEHYHKVYALRLKYPHLPALDVGRKKKPTYIPLELCKILPGQRYTKTLSKGQRQKQIDACKQTPQDRKMICERAMEVNRYDNDPLINEFGMKFNPELTKVNGRVLDPPHLEFGRGKIETPRDGRWNFNGKTMQSGCRIENWAVAVFDDRCRDADNVACQLVQCCNKSGMEMSPPAGIEKEPHMAANATPEIRVQNMLAALRRHKPTFILVILPMDAKKDEIYVQFKKKCEQMIGVVSQCMVKPRNLNIQYLANLALKINLKMGGYNSPLSDQMSKFLGGPTIIFGMDVSHGSPGDADSPSVAAVVATKGWPKVSGMFSSQARTQAAKLEMIEGLCDENGDGMVKDAIMEFYHSCDKSIPPELRKPSQIIIYRDGVSEGQFKQCLDLELNAFKTACENLPGNYNPKITFIVAQKRHNTRFFPARQGQGECMRNGNVIPGTVVDKDVCHPFNYDFFLSAHAGLIVHSLILVMDPLSGGTTRPTHYHVLHNENRFSPDELQQLTNNLCYTFARCSTAIGIAAPAAYAHLVATRFRKFVDSDMGSDTNSSLGSSRAGSRPAKEFGKCRISKDMYKFPMYFC